MSHSKYIKIHTQHYPTIGRTAIGNKSYIVVTCYSMTHMRNTYCILLWFSHGSNIEKDSHISHGEVLHMDIWLRLKIGYPQFHG